MPAPDYSTLNSVSKRFGITDEDIKSGYTDLFECLRAVAGNGGKHIPRFSDQLAPDKLKDKVRETLASGRSIRNVSMTLRQLWNEFSVAG